MFEPSWSLQRRSPPPPLSWRPLEGSSVCQTETWWPFPSQCPHLAGSERRGLQEYLNNVSMQFKDYKLDDNPYLNEGSNDHVKHSKLTNWCLVFTKKYNLYIQFSRLKSSRTSHPYVSYTGRLRTYRSVLCQAHRGIIWLYNGAKKYSPLASILKIETSAAFTWLNSAVSSESTNINRFFICHSWEYNFLQNQRPMCCLEWQVN